jgi:hypothetical protein
MSLIVCFYEPQPNMVERLMATIMNRHPLLDTVLFQTLRSGWGGSANIVYVPEYMSLHHIEYTVLPLLRIRGLQMFSYRMEPEGALTISPYEVTTPFPYIISNNNNNNNSSSVAAPTTNTDSIETTTIQTANMSIK